MKLSTNIQREIDTIITTLTMLDIKTHIKKNSIILNNQHYDIKFELKQTKYRIRFVFYKDLFCFLSFSEIHRAKNPIDTPNIVVLFENDNIEECTEETILYITRIIKRNTILSNL